MKRCIQQYTKSSKSVKQKPTIGKKNFELFYTIHRCSEARSPNKVMFYLNESPAPVDGCSVGLCDWDYLKERFERTANDCTLNFCYDPNAAAQLDGHAIVYLLVAGLAVVRSLSAL